MSAQKSSFNHFQESDQAPSYSDGAFEPQSTFNFGEAQEQDRNLYKDFTPMEDVRDSQLHHGPGVTLSDQK
jgi:hypothetical protein